MYSEFYLDRRVRSFQKRKGIYNQNRFQAFVVAVILVILPIVVFDYVSAQRQLEATKIRYEVGHEQRR